jgi:hypothetical protein
MRAIIAERAAMVYFKAQTLPKLMLKLLLEQLSAR